MPAQLLTLSELLKPPVTGLLIKGAIRMFTFNGNYKDLEQVAEFLPAFLKKHDEITTQGKYPYNDSFVGDVDGLFASESDEKTAIYLLQGLRRKRITANRVGQALDNGFVPFEAAHDGDHKFEAVIIYTDHEWREYEAPKVVVRKGCVEGLIPKGKRTHGYSLLGKNLLVKA